ncbi:hypothetical protein [Phenylobacterium sp.]|uniref:hypothetical protein n=1 Tax=Phenylobacterium sp. TaxID=1871053 RepID=UPI0027330935|nr:hypothetical protein [Phenylobacterium sp.]MDP3591402.1 hypothetical protein [Phenylobacterium sp.]
MKDFRCLVGLKHPPQRVAAGVRDMMDQVAPALDQVEKIAAVTRVDRPDGGCALVNEWRVSPTLPATLNGLVTPDMLGWLDHAEWSSDLALCTWRIEPYFMAQAINCHGTTRFEPAMGGRGTRAVFEGKLDIDPAAMSTIPMAWRSPASLAVEMLIGTIIPQNFRKTVNAVAELLETQPTSTP